MDTFEHYYAIAPNVSEVNFWDLPKGLKLVLYNNPKFNYLNKKSIGEILKLYGKNLELNRTIKYVLSKNGRLLPIRFPLNLKSIDYVRLYSLMLSEGSYKTEFSLNVPESEFHEIFIKSLCKLCGTEIRDYIKQDKNNGFLRSRVNRIIRWVIPIPEHIPKFILSSDKLSKEYLKIAFEAEGSPVFTKQGGCTKRYIRLTRNTDVSKIFKKLHAPYTEFTFNELDKNAKNFVLSNPSLSILGEHLILKNNFCINSSLKPEKVRINKTHFRKGKVSAKWALHIYADSLDKFLKDIGFISERKKGIANKMMKVKGRKAQFSALELIKTIKSKDNTFLRKDFIKEMKNRGYISSQAFLWRYSNKNLIKRVKRGIYQLLFN